MPVRCCRQDPTSGAVDARIRLGRRSIGRNSKNRGLVRALKRSGRGEDSPMSTKFAACQVEAEWDIC